MKKLISVVLALVLALTLSVSALAAPNGFVESPTNQKGPEVVEGEGIVLTPFGDRDNLTDEERKALEDAYNSILNADNLGEICEALDELAKQTGIPVEDLIVSELFNISPEDASDNGDGKYNVTLKDDSLGDFFALMQYVDGKWNLVGDAKVEDGKLTFVATDLAAPFAIVVNPNGDDGNSDDIVPPTGEDNGMVTAIAIGGVSLVSLAGVYFVFKKREA